MTGWLDRLLHPGAHHVAAAPIRPELVEVPVPPVGAVGSPRVLAIDFETANASRASPCLIGIAWIGGGWVTHWAYRLIRLEQMRTTGTLNVADDRDLRREPG